MRVAIVAAFITLLMGCSSMPPIDAMKQSDGSQKAQRALLVGSWFGDAATNDGGRRLQLTQRAPDGTYKVTFRLIDATGEVLEETEVGFWGVSGSVYFTIMRGTLEEGRIVEADPTDPIFNDAYHILELTQERFRYRSLQTTNEFSLSRVADTFSLPAR